MDKSITTNKGFDIESLLKVAVDKSLPLEQMERLLSMRRELKAEFARDEFYKSLSHFQSSCPIVKKENSVNYQSKKGGYVKYDYASLDNIVSQVKEKLFADGFSYTIKTEQTKDGVTAICCAHHKEGHTEETAFFIPIDYEAFMNAAQKVASALTYAKRYAFCNAFGIMTGDEDDDSNSLSREEVYKDSKNQKVVGKTTVKESQPLTQTDPDLEYSFIETLEAFFKSNNTNPEQKALILAAVEKRKKNPTACKTYVQSIVEKAETMKALDASIMALNEDLREPWIVKKESCEKIEQYKAVLEELRDYLFNTPGARKSSELKAAPKVETPVTPIKEIPATVEEMLF